MNICLFEGMSICQNNGKCVFLSDLKINCICQEGFYGQFCERKALGGSEEGVTQPICLTKK